MEDAKYQTLERYKAVKEVCIGIEHFIDWLRANNGVAFGRWTKGGRFWPMNIDVKSLVLEYFGIDPKQLELERRQLISNADKRT